MPYVIECNRRVYLPTEPGASPMWRDESGESRAVADLKSAAAYLAPIVQDGAITIPGTCQTADGQPINVEHVEWHELWHRAHSGKGPRDWMHVPFDDILGAYNAHHERA